MAYHVVITGSYFHFLKNCKSVLFPFFVERGLGHDMNNVPICFSDAALIIRHRSFDGRMINLPILRPGLIDKKKKKDQKGQKDWGMMLDSHNYDSQ